jgi:hypothetical protein
VILEMKEPKARDRFQSGTAKIKPRPTRRGGTTQKIAHPVEHAIAPRFVSRIPFSLRLRCLPLERVAALQELTAFRLINRGNGVEVEWLGCFTDLVNAHANV